MIKLGVNIDHIATLRQARMEDFPSPLKAASVCEKAGADSITTHLREDRRHIQDRDIFEIKESLRTRLNFEMAACDEIVQIALKVQPYSVCIVPEKRQEVTTEGGLDVFSQKKRLSEIVKKLRDTGIIVSMFIDPEIKQIEACADIKADAVEIHTGKYAQLFKINSPDVNSELERIKQASIAATERKLIFNAGHGLDYKNVSKICEMKNLNELNIGFAILAQALFDGLEKAVGDMKEILSQY
ncbi:MAG: pyridoxine 5'-phosphate synthase [Endomicrobiaceae bacterium]|jgi:pyridoxine 5-phosphate synthase|nr:pyridoxine 5'-phosphate synthase [Endomicrobiaceae bacterium]MDD3052998.1 pyridoxine 5'-phosphate synthase [Endomicrobiaceae bacterium]MDD3922934.1 pyridoxine 5'-phosphate synthase [Endomicrobiaceae bacterium]